MALVGGGGAGNVAGSNPAGTGSTLNYVGNLCYAYSGPFADSQTPQTVLDFSTGNEIIRGILQFNAFVQEDDPADGSRGTCTLEMDGQVIAILKADGLEDDTPNVATQDLVIPPFTRFTAKIDSSGTTSTHKATVLFTGRLH